MNLSHVIQENILLTRDADDIVLTKELLRYKTKRGKILPKLIDPEAPKFLEIAEELLVAHSESVGEVREKLERRTKQVLDRFSLNVLLGRGLEKLLLDRTEFDTVEKIELTKLREKVFSGSAKLLNVKERRRIQDPELGLFADLEKFQREVSRSVGIPAEDLRRQIYGDLPPFHKVIHFRKMDAKGLLHRYNCAQIQGLLMRSEGLSVCLPESSAASLRQLLKYLRFYKLLAKISYDLTREKTILLEIDGPLSLFVQTRKYGFNLANFFPAILHQPKWGLDAEVRINKKHVHSLHIDQSCRIRSHYRQFYAFIPEEIQLFSQQLAKQIPGWQLTASPEFVPLTGESLCFPDYLLTHSSGKKVALELFHTWHAVPLHSRLIQLDAKKKAPLLIGVSRSLLKNEQIVEHLEASEYFSRYGFYYRETPSATRLVPLLDAWLKK